MKTTLVQLRDQLGRDPDYFQKVYNHTFEFARSDGQRSLGMNSNEVPRLTATDLCRHRDCPGILGSSSSAWASWRGIGPRGPRR
jgi:hypothetical protein